MTQHKKINEENMFSYFPMFFYHDEIGNKHIFWYTSTGNVQITLF